MANKKTPYISAPLDAQKAQIRLVRLQPRRGHDEICCALEVVDFDDVKRASYTALSYEWGDTKASASIVLGGCNFPIRPNLWWALWHLRGEDEAMVIWIDALCIDQENFGERNHQVSSRSFFL
jgi:hypothetical protein